jgi:hypothetical protein
VLRVRRLLFMSILFATFAIPMRAARTTGAVRGLRRAVIGMAIWIVVYAMLLSFFRLV